MRRFTHNIGDFPQRKPAQAPKVGPVGGKKQFFIEKPRSFVAFFIMEFFIDGFHNFIGDFQILLAKKLIYWRFHPTYWRKSKFIGELEIPGVFFQFKLRLLG